MLYIYQEEQVDIESAKEFEKLYLEKKLTSPEEYDDKWCWGNSGVMLASSHDEWVYHNLVINNPPIDVIRRDVMFSDTLTPSIKPTVLPNSMLSKIGVYEESTGKSGFRIGKKPVKQMLSKLLLSEESHKVKLFKVPGMPSRMMTSITKGHDLLEESKQPKKTDEIVDDSPHSTNELNHQENSNMQNHMQNGIKVINTHDSNQIINLINATDANNILFKMGEHDSTIDRSSSLHGSSTVIADVIVSSGIMSNNNNINNNRAINVISPAILNKTDGLPTILPKGKSIVIHPDIVNKLQKTARVESKKKFDINEESRATKKPIINKQNILSNPLKVIEKMNYVRHEDNVYCNLDNRHDYSRYPIVSRLIKILF